MGGDPARFGRGVGLPATIQPRSPSHRKCMGTPKINDPRPRFADEGGYLGSSNRSMGKNQPKQRTALITHTINARSAASRHRRQRRPDPILNKSYLPDLKCTILFETQCTCSHDHSLSEASFGIVLLSSSGIPIFSFLKLSYSMDNRKRVGDLF